MAEIVITIFKVEDIEVLSKADVFVVANEKFATRYTASFSFENIIIAREITSKINKKLFVQVNRIFEDEQLVDLVHFLKFLKEVDVDGIYFADLAVYEIANQLGISDKLIYNPDTLLTNSYDINFFNNKGLLAVTISKEASFYDVQEIVKNKNGHLELIVHGYLQMFYSKRHLLENYFKNFGLDCKNNNGYQIQEISREEKYPILEEESGTSIFTGSMLCLIEHLEYLKNIDFLRIDGIFTDVNYLKVILDFYIRTLNGDKITLEDIAEFDQMRKYSTGLLFKEVDL